MDVLLSENTKIGDRSIARSSCSWIPWSLVFSQESSWEVFVLKSMRFHNVLCERANAFPLSVVKLPSAMC